MRWLIGVLIAPVAAALWLLFPAWLHWKDGGKRVGVQQVEAVSLAEAPEGGWLVYYHYWQDGYSGDYWGKNE